MDFINIDATDETPQVIMDVQSGQFEFSGKSLPEDVSAFYDPILEKLVEYAKSPASTTSVDFKFSYFNTASSKMILDVMLKLEEIAEDGHNITINWYSQEEDEDMQEAGEEYAEIVDIAFKMKKLE